MKEKRFAVGLSFPKVYREIIRKVANELSKKLTKDRVLYDEFHEAEFARPNFDVYLQNLFIKQTDLIVVFLCKAYNEDEWCGVEWRANRTRINETDMGSIMFLCFDDDDPEGFRKGVDNKLDVSTKTPLEIAELIENRYSFNKGNPIKKLIVDPYSELKEYLSDQLNRTKKKHPSFRLMEIDDSLFPEGIPELHNIEAINDANETKTVEEIVAASWGREKNHLMIEGEGGIGKTVTLLSLPEKFVPHKVPAIYVQLHELKGIKEEETIEEYIKSKYFSSKETLYRQFLTLADDQWRDGPRVLLLLDGFNEIAPERRYSIGRDINRWAERSGVQIVTSSRYDIHSYVPIGEGYSRIMLQPLSRETVNEFLIRLRISTPTTEGQWKVINYPLMLTLYAQTRIVMDNIDKREDLQDFKENNSAGAILWNYLQREIWRFREKKADVAKCVLATEFIAPFIAWQMHKESKFYLEEQSFEYYLDQAYGRFIELGNVQLPPHIRSVLRRYRLDVKDSSDIQSFIEEEICLFTRNGKTYSLMHQQFRDALAALHLLNVVYSSCEFPKEWKALVDYYVMSFVADLCSQEEADILWERNRKMIPHEDFSTINMLELQKRKRKNDFSDLNFGGLDLRNISLFPYRKPESSILQLPHDGSLNEGLLLSRKSLYPEGNSSLYSINAIALSPDGRRCISGSSDRNLCIWDIESGQCLRTLRGHLKPIRALAITPDGKRCISGSTDCTLRIWDLESGLCQLILNGAESFVNTLAITPDGKLCVSGSSDKVLRCWDLESGQCLRTLNGHLDAIRALAITPDGQRCISGSDDRTLRIWDLDSGQCIKVLEGHSKPIRAVAVIPDGQRCISGSQDSTLRVWNIESGECLMTLKACDGAVKALAITPDGKRCINGSGKHSLCIWDLDFGKCEKTLSGFDCSIRSLAITPDGRRFISGSDNSDLCVWDIVSGQCLRTLEGEKDFIKYFGVSQDGKLGVSGLIDKTLRVWNLNSGRCLSVFEAHKSTIHALSITPDGRKCASWSTDNNLYGWDVLSGRALWRQQFGPVETLSITPDGKRCVTGLKGKNLRIWDMESGQSLSTIDDQSGRKGVIKLLVISPDGRKCVCGSNSKYLYVWNLESGQLLMTLAGHKKRIRSLVFTPDGKKCISGSKDKTLRIWNLESGKCLFVLEGHDSPVCVIAITPDGKRCISGSSDSVIRVWDVDSGRCLNLLKGHKSSINALVITPDGKLCISASTDTTLRIWEIDSGNCLNSIILPKDTIASLFISLDGEKCIAVSIKNSIYVWNLDSLLLGSIKILPLSLIGVDLSRSIISSSLFKEEIRQNGAIV